MEAIADSAHWLWDFYLWTLTRADPRVSDWPLMGSFWPTWLLVFAYLLAIWLGPKLMSNRRPFDLRWPLVIYNAALVLLNFYIVYELVYCSWRRRYSLVCQSVHYGSDEFELRIAKAIWWYYISKGVEFMDTIFFVLRKKNGQMSFLHVYHHATMFPIWWIGVKWVAGGQIFLGALLNSFVHVVMYAYYALSAMGPAVQKFLWWKRYLTRLQLSQFCAGIVIGGYAILTGCRALPPWIEFGQVAYQISLLALFVNYYRKQYRRKTPDERRKAD